MLDRRRLLGAAGVALAGRSPRAAAQSAKRVVLYTSNNVEAVQTALDAIGKRRPALNVQQVTGGTGVLMKRVQAERANPGGDVFWSGGFGTLGAFSDCFEPYEPKDAAHVPAEFREPSNLWTGTNVHVMVVMVNATQLRGFRAPKGWADLLDDGWKGRFAITDPSSSSAAYIQVYGVSKMLGPDGLRRLARNAVVTGSTGQTYKGVGTGEYAAGITMEYAAYEYVDAGQRDISLVYPAEGTFLSPEGIVLIKGAKNPEGARALYDGFLSRDVQEELLRTSFRRPSRSDIEVSKLVKLPELAALKVFPIDQAEATREYDAVIRSWNGAVAQAKRD